MRTRLPPPTRLIPALAEADLADFLEGDRFRAPGGGPGAAELEAAVNLRLEVNHGPKEALLPFAIASVLCEHLDDDGAFNVDRFQAAFGDAGKKLLDALPFRDGGNRSDRYLGGGRSWGRGILIRSMIAERERAEEPMPLLALVLEHFGDPALLKNSGLFAIQHIFDTTLLLLKSLEACGLPSRRSFVVGKRYSTDPIAQLRIRDRGYNVSQLALAHGLPGHGSWRPDQNPSEADTGAKLDALFDTFLDGLKPILPGHQAVLVLRTTGTFNSRSDPTGIDNAIVVDDGADAILALDKRIRAGEIARGAGVEQTRFGARRLKGAQLSLGVVNVAESIVKLCMESVLIGWSVTQELERILDELKEQGIEKGKRVALIGYGSVGRAVAVALRERGFTIDVLETDPERAQLAAQDGFEVAADRKLALSRADHVVGATGTTALDGDDFCSIKQGALLSSVSSSNIEFAVQDPRVTTRDTVVVSGSAGRSAGIIEFEGKKLRAGPYVNSDHWHRVVVADGKELLLIRSGFPINFTGERDPIPAVLIQLTRALLLLGALQAARLAPDAKGLIDLDARGQRLIADAFMAQVRGAGLLSPALMALLEEGYAKVRAATTDAVIG